jgi:hypothetical protein
MRRIEPHKDASRLATRATVAQVHCQRFPNIPRKGHAIVKLPFPSHHDFACVPVDVLQLHGNDLAGTKPEA